MSNDPLAPVAEILSRHGGRCSASDFHAAVNVTFHQFESEHYDELHQQMWDSLPAQIALLAGDCLQKGAPERIRMLDIGSGTGLATDCLLRTALGERVETADLVDTSPAMLARATARRKQWNKPGEAIEGLVESLVGKKQYDLIITCSVLHHVPDLPSFLNAVSELQKDVPHAIFLHLQDPNWDFRNDTDFLSRQAAEKKAPEWIARLSPSRIFSRLAREMKGEQGQDYISRTNKVLLEQGVIQSPLTVAELFAITDIHAQEDDGISIKQIEGWLPGYELVSKRSYAFFGKLSSELAPAQREQEEAWIGQGALNGGYVGAAWRRR